MNVVIDPYMLELKNEWEVREGIAFFQLLVELCNSNQIHVYLDEAFLKKLSNRGLQPFPIQISKIKDRCLIESIQRLNSLFAHVVINKELKPLDLIGCTGELNPVVSRCENFVKSIFAGSELYSDLIYILTTPCYNSALNISEYIITGENVGPISAGTKFGIDCSCEQCAFKYDYQFALLDRFEDAKHKSKSVLKHMAQNGELAFIDSPVIIKGDHHNHIQSQFFDTFGELSNRNKTVLKILRYFGLNKIVFGRFYDNNTRRYGNIDINECKVNDTNSVLCGSMHCETGYKYDVELYFPREVGIHLETIIGREFAYKEVNDLKDYLLLG